jgi:hypothetical protein
MEARIQTGALPAGCHERLVCAHHGHAENGVQVLCMKPEHGRRVREHAKVVWDSPKTAPIVI